MKVNQRVNGISGQEEKYQHEPAQQIKTAWVTQMCGASQEERAYRAGEEAFQVDRKQRRRYGGGKEQSHSLC